MLEERKHPYFLKAKVKDEVLIKGRESTEVFDKVEL